MNLTRLPGWPALLAHELTHAVVAQPFAETSIRWRTTTPHVELDWQAGTPRLAVWCAHLAPTILGGLTAALTLFVVAEVVSMGMPSNPFHTAAVALLVGYNWLLYAFPSREDRRPFGGDG